MYGVFVSCNGIMDWVGNEPTEEAARETMNVIPETADFAFVIPLTAFRDIDGERESPATE